MRVFCVATMSSPFTTLSTLKPSDPFDHHVLGEGADELRVGGVADVDDVDAPLAALVRIVAVERDRRFGRGRGHRPVKGQRRRERRFMVDLERVGDRSVSRSAGSSG